jgi:hypothetical protein
MKVTEMCPLNSSRRSVRMSQLEENQSVFLRNLRLDDFNRILQGIPGFAKLEQKSQKYYTCFCSHVKATRVRQMAFPQASGFWGNLNKKKQTCYNHYVMGYILHPVSPFCSIQATDIKTFPLCMYVCMCVCMYSCIYVCLFVCLRACVYKTEYRFGLYS